MAYAGQSHSRHKDGTRTDDRHEHWEEGSLGRSTGGRENSIPRTNLRELHQPVGHQTHAVLSRGRCVCASRSRQFPAGCANCQPFGSPTHCRARERSGDTRARRLGARPAGFARDTRVFTCLHSWRYSTSLLTRRSPFYPPPRDEGANCHGRVTRWFWVGCRVGNHRDTQVRPRGRDTQVYGAA